MDELIQHVDACLGATSPTPSSPTPKVSLPVSTSQSSSLNCSAPTSQDFRTVLFSSHKYNLIAQFFSLHTVLTAGCFNGITCLPCVACLCILLHYIALSWQQLTTQFDGCMCTELTGGWLAARDWQADGSNCGWHRPTRAAGDICGRERLMKISLAG